MALFDQQQYETAVYAFEQARTLAPKGSADEAASCVDLALAYMRMERAGSSQAAIAKANECIARAIEIAPNDGRARFYRALLCIKQFRYGEALSDLDGNHKPQQQPDRKSCLRPADGQRGRAPADCSMNYIAHRFGR